MALLRFSSSSLASSSSSLWSSLVSLVLVVGLLAADTLVAAQQVVPLPSDLDLVLAERERCGGIVDMHLHLAFYFSEVGPLLEEMQKAGMSQGILYSNYIAGIPGLADPNTEVSRIIKDSGGIVSGFASLNTTGNWANERQFELDRLVTALDTTPEFVGIKFANPHTCLALNSDILADVCMEVSARVTPAKKIIAVHTGTTPFCGPLGDLFGLVTCCEYDFVSPFALQDLVVAHPDITFIMLHAGHDFLPPDDAKGNYYNGTLTDEAITMAQIHPNVILEISALHAQDDDGTIRYPGGDAAVQKMADAGVQDKVMWGSDANHRLNSLLPVAVTSFKSMIAAGFTDEQRCHSISGFSKQTFGLSTICPDFTFTLINADTKLALNQLVGDPAVVDYSNVDVCPLVNIRVNPDACHTNVQSVQITFQGQTRCENYAPYAAFGDANPGGPDIPLYYGSPPNYFGQVLPAGVSTVTAQGFANNGCTGASTAVFSQTLDVMGSCDGGKVTGFYFYNADSDQQGVLIGSEGHCVEGFQINVEAKTCCGAQSVRLELVGDATASRTENVAPYMLYGDNPNSGDIFGANLSAGSYTITATPYSQDGANGVQGVPLSVSFVVNDCA